MQVSTREMTDKYERYINQLNFAKKNKSCLF